MTTSTTLDTLPSPASSQLRSSSSLQTALPPELIYDGDPSSPIWLIGEALGENEKAQGRPFVGAAGWELDKMLQAAGLSRRLCFITNVCHDQPPPYRKNGKLIRNDIEQWFATKTAAKREHLPELHGRFPREPVRLGLQLLRSLLSVYHPNLIIALGNTPLWALTGLNGITKWRGSELRSIFGPKVIPTFHPADVLRTYPHRSIVISDLRRAKREAEYPQLIKPQFNVLVPKAPSDISDWLREHPGPLTCDIEGWSCIDCLGLGASPDQAICIPFRHVSASPEKSVHYWSEDEEFEVIKILEEALTTRSVTFHNGTWDCSIIASFWGFMPKIKHDTQVMQHVCFPGLLGGKIDPVTGQAEKRGSSLSLSFLASMYCEHYSFWKDDGRLFDPSIHDERQLWNYNGEDCCRTFEVRDVLEDVLKGYNLWDQYLEQMSLFPSTFAMSFRGLRMSQRHLHIYDRYIQRKLHSIQQWLDSVIGQPFNPASNAQCHSLFYDALRVDKILHKKSKNATLDDDALSLISRRQPLLSPLCEQIQNWRALSRREDFVSLDRLSADGRFHCSFNLTGTETFRFSTTKDCFGDGANTQNWPRPSDE